MVPRGGPGFLRWRSSIAAALLLHGAAGWLLVSAPLRLDTDTRAPAPLWLELAGPVPELRANEQASTAVASAAGAAGESSRTHGSGSEASVGSASHRRQGSAGRSRVAPAARRAASSTTGTAAPDPDAPGEATVAPLALPGLGVARYVARASASPGSADAGAGGDTSPGGDTGGGSARTAGARRGTGAASGEPAHLLARGNPCADLFPYAAQSDSGVVAVALDVAVSGQPHESQIVGEAPAGQGFALAARECVRRLRFAPAIDSSGKAIASRSVVKLRFERQQRAL